MAKYTKPTNVISVELRKREIGGLGFLVRERRGRAPVVVSEIIQGGAAYDSGLVSAGDIIIAVNSRSLLDLTYQDALAALRAVSVGGKALLLVRTPDGYAARLETAVDSGGNAKTLRVTESISKRNMAVSWSDGLTKNGGEIFSSFVSNDGYSINGYEATVGAEKSSNFSCACLSTQPLSAFAKRNETTPNMATVIQAEPGSRKLGNHVVTKEKCNGTHNGVKANGIEENGVGTAKINGGVANGVKANGIEENGVGPAKVNGGVANGGVHDGKHESAHVHKTLSASASYQGCPMRSSVSEENEAFFKLKNWETGHYTNDTLFAKTRAVTGCARNRCIGSIMGPKHMTLDPRKRIKTKEEKLQLATDFIKQYYGSLKRKNPEAERKRLAEVVESIEDTGTYDLTEYELIFGAKTAWRNAPRCIGRIQWNKLQVFDYRKVENTAQMFDAICNHLKYATNKGNIRSCITFFPQRSDDYQKDFRVWNSQYIRYAGYKQPDGSILGDPANAEITELCLNLGWKPKGGRGRFDLLPLLLQANGEDPDLYELPPELVMEVQLRHPRFEWFKDLGYKWYAVPAVSNILLDIGGIEFPAAPFNGWFMGTEIGRDLCDVARYNVIEEVAEKMKLDTKNLSSLWKDIALVQFNVAVLYSYQSDRVTIMDHHSATQSFMKHYANELKLRGGCPGDWVWLTPPLSGSLTPIFHQEILNYSLNPSCEYQPDPWIYHKWKGRKIERKKKSIRFKELAKSVLLMSSMMGKAMANRVKATILYASETGKSLEYAKTLQDIFNHAFAAKVIPMDEYDIGHLEHETLVLVVTSTFGNGDPPENGEGLAQALIEMARGTDENGSEGKRFTSISNVTSMGRRASTASLNYDPNMQDLSGFLANLRFSVFGLGSRAYPHFCAFAHAVDTLLGEMQGERLLEIGLGDELCGQEESFRKWAKDVFRAACETFCVGEDVSSEAASASLAGQDRSWSPEKFRVAPCEDGEEEPDLLESLSTFTKKDLSACSLISRKNLQSGEDNNRATILVEIDSSDAENIAYQPGDHIGIYPCNQPELVEKILGRLQDDLDPDCLIQLQMFEQRSTPVGMISNWVPDKRLPTCTLKTAFERYLDITTCPSPLLLKLFADCAADEREKARLNELSEGKHEYEEWKFNNTPNLPEVLDEFPSVKVEASLLLSQLHPLQCRYYSISSSPDMYPKQVHCTVAIVNYRTQGGTGPLHHGVCSSYLNRVPMNTELYCFIRPAVTFRLPEDHTVPCLLIGPGTGIAPFRSFWQQRIHDIKEGKRTGDMALLFGCRHPERDHLYKEEISEAQNCNAITKYSTAFSRLPGKPKQYVQHILRDSLADLAYDWLVKKEGHLYICGDVTMADDVNKAFMEVLMQKGNMSKEQARNHVTEMKTRRRRQIHEDVFGYTAISLKPGRASA